MMHTLKNLVIRDAMQGARRAEAETVCFITVRLRAPRNAAMRPKHEFVRFT